VKRPLAALAAVIVLAGTAACGSGESRFSAQPFILEDVPVAFGGLVVIGDGTVVAAGPRGIKTIDPATLTITATVGGSGSERVLAGSDPSHVFLGRDKTLARLDLRTHLTTSALPAGSKLELPTEPICVCAGGKLLFGSEAGQESLVVVDLPAGRIATTITDPRSWSDIAVVPDGSRVYLVPDKFDGPVRVVDVATGTSTPVLGTEDALSLAVSTDGPRVWINGTSGLAVIDGDGTTARRISPHGPDTGRFVGSPDGRLLVGLDTKGKVTIIDTTDGREIAGVEVDGMPTAAAFAPDSSRLWVGTENGLVGIPLRP
jgi:hypothetical protein